MTSTAADIRVKLPSTPHYVESPIIRVIVGGDLVRHGEYFVHENLICARSEFFRKAMNGEWEESEERIVSLPEDEPEALSLYLKLLYTGTLLVKDNTKSTNPTAVIEEYLCLAKVFVLAEKFMDDAAKDAALAAILARSKEPFSDGQLYYPCLDTVQTIYEGTTPDSPARKLLVGLYTHNVTTAFTITDSDRVSKDFLQDLALALLVSRPLQEVHEDLKIELTSARRELSEAAMKIKKPENKKKVKFPFDELGSSSGSDRFVASTLCRFSN